MRFKFEDIEVWQLSMEQTDKIYIHYFILKNSNISYIQTTQHLIQHFEIDAINPTYNQKNN